MAKCTIRTSRGYGRNTWYATLQNPHSGELMKFANLEQLWEFIQQQTDNPGQKTD